MKILYSCLSKSWGGMEMITITSIKKLLDRKCEITLICLKESRIHIEANELGIIIYPLSASKILYIVNIFILNNLIKENRFDLIHTHASKDLWLLVPTLKLVRKNTPLFLTKHVGSFINKKDFFHRIIYKRVTKLFAISNVIKQNLLDTCPVDESKVILLHNGIDTDYFSSNEEIKIEGRRKWGIKKQELVIGMMGRFSPGKGHEEFLEAAIELNKKHDHLKFMIIGEASRGEDDFATKIKNLAKENKINNITFTGYIKDVRETLSALDIFVFPSHAEAFGLALAEAMAMGLPSVCSNSDGVLDIAVDEETSFLFENKNSKNLTEKIELLISSKDKRKNFGQKGRERIINNFNLESKTDMVIKIYEDHLNEA